MSELEELKALRRLAELEDRAGNTSYSATQVAPAPQEPQARKPAQAKPEPDFSEKIMGNPLIMFARGAAAPVMGGLQLALQALHPSPKANKAFQEQFIDRPAAMEEAGSQGSIAGKVAKFAGNVLSPLPLVAGKALPVATSLAGRIKQGMQMGAIYGGTAPVENAGDDFAEKKIINTGLSSLFGGLLPAGWEGSKLVGRGVRNLVQPLLGEKGLNAASGRIANNVAGEAKAKIIALLEKTDDFVPGSKLTAGQAAVPANSAEFSALQDMVSKVKPSYYFGPKGIQGQQEAARIAQIQKISGGADDTALNNAIALRTAITEPLYKSVKNSKANVDARDVLLKVNEYLKSNGNQKNIRIPLEDVRKKLIVGQSGRTLKIEKNPQALASLSKEISAKMGSKTAHGQPEFDVKVLREIKDILDDAIGKAEPNYAKARSLFKEKSIPINQMQVGKELESRLLNPSGKETSGAYLKSLDDSFKVLKDATGFSRYKDISQVLREKTPLATSVAKDLENNLIYKELASKGRAASKELSGELTDGYKGVGLLKTPIVIMNAVINRLEGKTGKLTAEQLSKKMQNPKEMARIMKEAKPFERQAIVDAFMKKQGTAAGAATVMATEEK